MDFEISNFITPLWGGAIGYITNDISVSGL